jgi:hypothetical protein
MGGKTDIVTDTDEPLGRVILIPPECIPNENTTSCVNNFEDSAMNVNYYL